MIFYCEVYDFWMITNALYRVGLIEDNGGGCGGFRGSYAGSVSGENWWNYTWSNCPSPVGTLV